MNHSIFRQSLPVAADFQIIYPFRKSLMMAHAHRNPKNIPSMAEADEIHLKKERHKARLLRDSQWWKRRCAKGVCYYCDRPVPPKDLTMDHVVPISRGGKSTKGNVVASCKECNTNKKQFLPMEWQQYLNQFNP